MTSTSMKVGLGALLILASTLAFFAIGLLGSPLPTSVAGLAALAMAAGALVLGMSEADASV